MKKHHAQNSHKDGHMHKNEMAHHKMRDSHKAAHESKMSQHKAGSVPISQMGANPSHLIGGSSGDNHQEGINRVKQRPGSMPVGQHGSMADGWRHERHKE